MDENRTNELNKALAALWDSLTDEQKNKAKECKSTEELMLLAGAAGIELPDEMLSFATGGDGDPGANGYSGYCPYHKGSHPKGVIQYKGTKTIKVGSNGNTLNAHEYYCSKNQRTYYYSPIFGHYFDEKYKRIGISCF